MTRPAKRSVALNSERGEKRTRRGGLVGNYTCAQHRAGRVLLQGLLQPVAHPDRFRCLRWDPVERY